MGQNYLAVLSRIVFRITAHRCLLSFFEAVTEELFGKRVFLAFDSFSSGINIVFVIMQNLRNAKTISLGLK
jgi:hypothetical protein